MTLPFAIILLLRVAPCAPATGDAHALLESAAAATGLPSAGPRVFHSQGFDVVSHDYESDRMYPPFLSSVGAFDSWFAPQSGVERTSTRSSIAGGAFSGGTTLSSVRASYAVRDTGLVESESVHSSLYATRPLNVWAMLGDWLSSPDVRVVERCEYRDYPRLVLSRSGPKGEERLYLNEKNQIPIKVDRFEPHYLWGQVHVEFVYSTWQRLGEFLVPGVTFRVVDGQTNVERVFGDLQWSSPDSAPPLSIPHRDAAMGYPRAAFLVTSRPDTVRVSQNTFLLRNPGYAEAVTLDRDTVYVFDATQGEARAREDSAWIGKLFPGHHPIVVVVTDLAWPHVAGVRFWVARGATIVAHKAARSFLQSVIDHRWTAAPDLLERTRSSSRFRFVGVSDSVRLGGGDILLFPIDGKTSEVALAAFFTPDRFLWASDYIQTLREPSAYLDDVWDAVGRARIAPDRVAAEHLPLSPWSAADSLARRPKG